MQTWVRRLRGAIGTALTWAVAWFVAGLVFMVTVAPHPENPFFVAWGALGFVAGLTFAGILGIMERRRMIHRLTRKRFAVLGALGGLAVAVIVHAAGLIGDFFLIAPLFAFAGASCAAGSLMLARKGEPSLLRSSSDLFDPIHTPDDERKLPE